MALPRFASLVPLLHVPCLPSCPGVSVVVLVFYPHLVFTPPTAVESQWKREYVVFLNNACTETSNAYLAVRKDIDAIDTRTLFLSARRIRISKSTHAAIRVFFLPSVFEWYPLIQIYQLLCDICSVQISSDFDPHTLR